MNATKVTLQRIVITHHWEKVIIVPESVRQWARDADAVLGGLAL